MELPLWKATKLEKVNSRLKDADNYQHLIIISRENHFCFRKEQVTDLKRVNLLTNARLAWYVFNSR